MKLFKYFLIVFILFSMSGCAAPGIKVAKNPEPGTIFREAGFEPAGEITEEYTLGPADVLEIRVWGYEDLKQLITYRLTVFRQFILLGK